MEREYKWVDIGEWIEGNLFYSENEYGIICQISSGRRARMSTYTPIYAVDFDGTLCENQWPDVGAPNMILIRYLIKRREDGCKVILWTCRVEQRLQEAVDWCRSYGLEFDAVNDNLPECIEKFGNNCRKVFANFYIDDLAADRRKYGIPYRADSIVKSYLERYTIGSMWTLRTEHNHYIPVKVEKIYELISGEVYMKVGCVSEDPIWSFYSCEREIEWFINRMSFVDSSVMEGEHGSI